MTNRAWTRFRPAIGPTTGHHATISPRPRRPRPFARRLCALAGLAGLLAAPPVAHADALHVFAAGSLRQAMTALLATSGIPAKDLAAPVFGPSGTLRSRIERGEPADILASADLRQPRQLARAHGDRPVVLFAHNRMCALARDTLHATPATLLDRMLDPAVRLVTSTPGADPGGDYAWDIFARADAIHPGATAILEAKASKLLGNPQLKSSVPGRSLVQDIFLTGKADLMLGYCSGAPDVIRGVPGLVSVPLPPDLAVTPAYGLVVLTDNPLADRFAVFIMSERGQTILSQFGLLPVALDRPM